MFFTDLDEDGFLTMKELIKEEEVDEDDQKEFDAMDRDGDGKLSREELVKNFAPEHDEMKDKGEEGDTAEAQEDYINQFFEKQDIDKDGVITYEEFHAIRDEL